MLLFVQDVEFGQRLARIDSKFAQPFLLAGDVEPADLRAGLGFREQWNVKPG